KPRVGSAAEIEANPRARSAKLRAVRKRRAA
ncbi:MAG: 16S rRNA (cytosine(1402)-N(4))-methyltransferase, partial [Myxococcales bacterium]|nr:16S rRNA (cytosine(1402)-N(4))-methyltransferase [Myxococcales bacterium]